MLLVPGMYMHYARNPIHALSDGSRVEQGGRSHASSNGRREERRVVIHSAPHRHNVDAELPRGESWIGIHVAAFVPIPHSGGSKRVLDVSSFA